MPSKLRFGFYGVVSILALAGIGQALKTQFDINGIVKSESMARAELSRVQSLNSNLKAKKDAIDKTRADSLHYTHRLAEMISQYRDTDDFAVFDSPLIVAPTSRSDRARFYLPKGDHQLLIKMEMWKTPPPKKDSDGKPVFSRERIVLDNRDYEFPLSAGGYDLAFKHVEPAGFKYKDPCPLRIDVDGTPENFVAIRKDTGWVFPKPNGWSTRGTSQERIITSPNRIGQSDWIGSTLKSQYDLPLMDTTWSVRRKGGQLVKVDIEVSIRSPGPVTIGRRELGMFQRLQKKWDLEYIGAGIHSVSEPKD